MSGDRSRNQPSGSGGRGPRGEGPVRAEEVVNRGLGLYSQGRLAPALAEWRRALELDPGNQRAAEYVAYVEDHFPLLDEKFRAARLMRAQQGEAIEIEADDPADDLDAYESIELDVGTGDPPADAGLAAGSIAGREQSGVRPARRAEELALDALDEGWSLEGGQELWPSGRDEIDTAEIPGRPVLEPAATGSRPTEEMRPGLAMTLPGPLPAGSRVAATATDYEDPHAPTVERPAVLSQPMRADLGIDRSRVRADLGDDEASDSDNDSDPATGEITLPAPRRSPLDPAASSASGPGDSFAAADDGQLVGFDLSDFDGSLSLESSAEEAMSEPDDDASLGHTLPGGTAAPPGADRPPLAPEALDPDPLEVRVTFRLPLGGGEHDPGDDGDEDEATIDRLATGAADRRDTEEFRGDSIGMALADAASRANLPDAGVQEPSGSRDSGEHGAAVDPAERGEAQTRPEGHRRAPTEDPDIQASSVIVDETLLSFEDETHELPSLRLLADQAALADGAAPVVATSAVPDDDDDGDDVDDDDLSEQPDDEAEAESELQTTALYRRPLAAPQTAVSIELLAADLESALEDALADSSAEGEDLTRARVGWLIERARRAHDEHHHAVAVLAIDLALDEDPASAVAQKLIHSHHELFHRIYNSYLGDLREVPSLALAMESIPVDELDHRAAFLLSRVDGVLTIDDVLDVSGMPRLEAFRHLCRLLLRGILLLRP